MSHTPCWSSFVLALVFAAPLAAHGGQYRGGWNTPPMPPSGGPAGGGPTDAAPLTGARPSIPDGTSWQVWWEFNKDPLLEAATGARADATTGLDDFYLGRRRRAPAAAPAQALTNDDRDRIAEALVQALDSTGNRDVSTAAMIALAKLGRAPKGVDLTALFQRRLADGDQEVRESAALALGICGDKQAVPLLIDLLQDSAAGRKACGRAVDDRTRTFAAWSLGLLAARCADIADKQRVRDALLSLLLDHELVSRDLRVGLIEALGLLGGGEAGASKRLAWQTAAKLWVYYDRDLGKGDQLVQAHVPIAIARLLGRGDSDEHQRTKERLIAELQPQLRRHATVQQSAAMALGSLCLPGADGDDGPDARAAATLARSYRDATDQLTRFFAALSLGRIGGAANRAELLRLWPDSNRTIERPWLALALGLQARRGLRAGGDVDDQVGAMLLRELRATGNDDTMSAMAIALGLTGYVDAADTLTLHLDEVSLHWQLIGYCSIGLALLDQQQVADKLLALIEKHRRFPFIVQQAAIALGSFGDPRVVPALLGQLEKSDSTAVLASLANALAQVGDRDSAGPLIKVLLDGGRPLLARAFAAAALGSIADKDPLPWNTTIAVGMNYMATVDTLTNGSTGILDIL
ncbi:MAG: HEAT repeat domain-containing protein [Planctomycetes bacterium]|nr:HEAT repeat domain-containing protein [Planctomycetota bacterium]